MSIDWDKFNEDWDAFLTNLFESEANKPSGEKVSSLTAKEISDFLSRPLKLKTTSAKDEKDIHLIEIASWLRVIKHPSVILILGGRGWGKSALGYKIAEYLKGKADVFVVGLPKRARKLLTEWIGSVPSIEDVPPNAIVIIDESYNLFHARTSSSERSRILSNMINLSR